MNRHKYILATFLGIFFSITLFANPSCKVTRDKKDNIRQEKPINLIFIGNSITAGATLKDPKTQAPPVVCGSLVEQSTGIST